MYHVFFFILLFSSTYEFFSKSKNRLGVILFLLLLAFVTLRYGQGSDYFSYIYLFTSSADTFETYIKTHDLSYITQEIGFSAISYFWIKILHLSPETLSALFSSVSFFFVWLFIKKYSAKPITSLFFFYCTFFLIYPFSAIRQGVCLAIFIYYLIPLLQNKKYIKYYLLSLLLFTIHYSSIILFIIPLVTLVKKYNLSQVFLVSFITFVIGILVYKFLFSFFSALDIIGSKVEAYTTNNSLDILSLLLRTIIFIPIILNYKLYERNSLRDLFLKIYIFGFFLYFLFMASSLISSRINVFMRYFEIILLVDFLVYVFKRTSNKLISYVYIFSIMSVLYVKNISSIIDQGPYYAQINFYNYPYVSVFNKKKIIETRYIPPYYQQYVIYD
ncbi:MAG: hypothetical protein PETM_00112 [Petrimonas sp.]|jgi:hypothetical protein